MLLIPTFLLLLSKVERVIFYIIGGFMKKLVAIVLAALMALSMIACGAQKEEEPTTPAGILVKAFKEEAKKGSSTEDIAYALAENEILPFMTGAMELFDDEYTWFPGLTETPSGFKTAYSFGPMIGTIPFIGYVFELEDASKADAFIANLEKIADLNWNICTQADEMKSGKEGNKVCFVMAKKSFDDEE